MLHSTSSQYAEPLPEVLTPLFEKLLSDSSFTHVVSATSSSAKSLLPRVSAKLNAPTVSDVTSVEHDASTNSTTFTRPIYAGNAIATVKAPSGIPIKFFTVRGTAFAPTPSEDGATVEAKEVEPVQVADPRPATRRGRRTQERGHMAFIEVDAAACDTRGPIRIKFGG